MKKFISMVIAAALLCSCLPCVTAAEDTGVKLLAEYTFDDETTRDIVGGRNATLYNNASAASAVYADGVKGKALQLSRQGTEDKYWLSVPYTAFGSNTDAFSLSLWYKATGYNSEGEDSELFSFYNSGAEKFLYYSPAATAFQDKALTMKWDGSYGYANVITPYAADTWVHLVYVVSAQDGKNTITAYVNGKAVEVDQGGEWGNSLMSQLGIDRFTIGGKNPYKGGTTPSCLFYGQVDEIRLYAGALTQADAEAIYYETVGIENAGGVFFRPADGAVGDVTPIYSDGTYYLFFLHSTLQRWCYVTTTDFVHYSEVKVLRDFGGTGDVLCVDGTWHLFASLRENGTEVIHHYSGKSIDSLQDTGQNLVSDGETFVTDAWRDPRVWYDETIGKYRMLVCTNLKNGSGTGRHGALASLTSADLSQWVQEGVYYSSGYFTGSYECPDHFKVGNWYYLVFSDCSYGKQTYYVKSKSPNGPWQIPEDDTFDSLFFYAAKTVSNGTDRYVIGWAGDRTGSLYSLNADGTLTNSDFAGIGYAGNMIVHRLVQQENGDLAAVPVTQVTEYFQTPVANTFQSGTGNWTTGADWASAASEDTFAAILMQELPESFLLSFDLKTDAKQAGIALNVDASFEGNGYYFALDRQYSRLRQISGALSQVAGYYFPYASELERPVAVDTGKTYHITAVVDGQIAVLYVDGECALTTRMTERTRRNLGLFCYAGSAEFTNVCMKIHTDDPSAKLLAAYNFNDATTNDAIGNNDATLYDGASAAQGVYPDGVVGKALQLSAQGTGEKLWLSVPYAAFGSDRDSFTLSLWYKVAGYNEAGEDSELFSFYNSREEKFLFYAPAAAAFQDKAFVMKWNGTYGYANVLTPYAKDTWVHLTCAVSPEGTAIYINGKAATVEAGGDWTGCLMSQLGIDIFTIGGKNPYKGGDTPNCLFYGQVDEVCLYAGALSAEEAYAVYAQTSSHTHSYTQKVTAPTCTQRGYTTYTCVCGASYVSDYVPALGHAWGDWTVTAEASCTASGVKTRTCNRCGETETEKIAANCPSSRFTDAPAYGNWAHAGIDYCVKNGLFSGTSQTEFSPGGSMTRAMLVTVLYRLAGTPACTADNPFRDVDAGKWYAKAVLWAASENIVSGVGNGCFDPQRNVSREQIAVILYRFAVWRGMEVSGKAILTGFPDHAAVSDYAIAAMAWAVDAGFLSGVGSGSTARLCPKDSATRAQVATILMRFAQKSGS